jgi:hypothetical protein
MQAIMVGAFHNPAMAQSIVDRKKFEAASPDIGSIEDQVEAETMKRIQMGGPHSDPEIQRRIREYAGVEDDMIQSLSEIGEKYEEVENGG